MGLLLLLLRVRVLDSPLFKKMHDAAHKSGNFFLIFQSFDRFARYVRCILLGVPIWAIVGIIATFSPEIAMHMNIPEPINAGQSVMLCYLGLTIGDAASGLLSQILKSRRQALAVFYIFTLIVVTVMLSFSSYNATLFYLGMLLLGFGAGM